jgi:hypothetical protein
VMWWCVPENCICNVYIVNQFQTPFKEYNKIFEKYLAMILLSEY